MVYKRTTLDTTVGISDLPNDVVIVFRSCSYNTICLPSWKRAFKACDPLDAITTFLIFILFEIGRISAHNRLNTTIWRLHYFITRSYEGLFSCYRMLERAVNACCNLSQRYQNRERRKKKVKFEILFQRPAFEMRYRVGWFAFKMVTRRLAFLQFVLGD